MNNIAKCFKPGDKVLVISGSSNKGVVAIFRHYTAKGKAFCQGPGGRLHRIHITPDKLRPVK